MAGNRYEICISGSGGQGILLAGIILARAALLEGKNVTQTQSYGPESRGGASRCEVVISSEEIDYPKVTGIDLLLALTQEAFTKQLPNLKPGGVVLYDSLYVKQTPPDLKSFLAAPFTQLAISEYQNILVANMIALGALVGTSGVVGRDTVKSSLESSVKPHLVEINVKALQKGFEESDRFLAAKGKK
jgi:2-oxoglutarate ferredoxin oxidoreductase subunit gamma